MPRIVDRLTATEAPEMLADNRAVLTNDDAVSIGVDLDRPANGTSKACQIVGSVSSGCLWALA